MTDQSDFSSNPPRPPRPYGSGGNPFTPAKKRLAIVAGLFFLLLVMFVSALQTGRAGIIEISDREVGVIVNYVSGTKTVVNRPGYRLFMPLIEQAFKFDKSPQDFVMEGEKDRDPNHVRQLTVRAKDGSNFWFETLRIQYQLLPSQAHIILDDSGEGISFKQNWIRTYARSILRDEFGKYSASEVADTSTHAIAKQTTTLRLNNALKPHGIHVIEIITPKPKFEANYEKAIEDRKVANQEVEKLKMQKEQLLRERERRVANIERDKATEFALLKGSLEAKRISSEREALKMELEAEAYSISEVAMGQAMEKSKIQEARGLESQARKEAEGLLAKVQAVAKRGDILVREALAEKMASIEFQIIPYRRDPAPIRLEHLGAVPGGDR